MNKYLDELRTLTERVAMFIGNGKAITRVEAERLEFLRNRTGKTYDPINRLYKDLEK